MTAFTLSGLAGGPGRETGVVYEKLGFKQTNEMRFEPDSPNE